MKRSHIKGEMQKSFLLNCQFYKFKISISTVITNLNTLVNKPQNPINLKLKQNQNDLLKVTKKLQMLRQKQHEEISL